MSRARAAVPGKATELAVGGRGGEAGSWLGLLVAFDTVFLAVGTLVFEHLVEA